MKRYSVVLAVIATAAVIAAVVFASLYFGHERTKTEVVKVPAATGAAWKPSPFLPRGAAGPRELILFGSIKSLSPSGDHYQLRFGPAWILGGVTAKLAQAEDRGVICRPAACPPVENDSYVVGGHRLLTYLVPADASVTVLTGTINHTQVTVSELARLVKGEQVKNLPPLRPYGSMSAARFWIRVHVDTVSSLYQQYHP